MTFLAIAAIASTSYALTGVLPPLPVFPDGAWSVGSSLTYGVSIAEGSDTIAFTSRIAILGTEHEDATDMTLYWVEVDLTDLEGLSEELKGFFFENYGELPQAIRVNMLIPRYDLRLFLTDPSRVYHNFTEPGFIRKLYFQYNRQTPYDVETSLLGSFIALAAVDLLGSEIPEDFYTDRNIGITMIQDPQVFVTEISEGEITTDAGTLEGQTFSYTSTEDEGASGLLFYSLDLPILPLVTYTADWTRNVGSVHAEVELTAFTASGATTQIVGEPVTFDLNTLLYGS